MASSGTPRRQYHPHSTFVLYCGVTLLVAIGAFNSNNNLLYWLFGLSLGMMLVSGLISGVMMMVVSVRRVGIAPAHAGGALVVRYAVSNRSRWVPAFALTIREEPDKPEPGEVGARGTIDEPPLAFVAHVPPGQTLEVEGVCRAEARGRVGFRSVRIETAFPFGIIRKSLRFDEHASTIVRPRVIEVPAQALKTPRGAGAPGESLARSSGVGDEFVALRGYVEGDAPKMIAWRASARGSGPGDLLVRQTASAAPRRVWVLLEVGANDTPEDRERAISLAAGAIMAAQHAGMHVGLVASAWDVSSPPRAGQWQVGGLLNDLGLLAIQPPSVSVHHLAHVRTPMKMAHPSDVQLVITRDGYRSLGAGTLTSREAHTRGVGA
jgi:uncharacterized protein (DUF58 family)